MGCTLQAAASRRRKYPQRLRRARAIRHGCYAHMPFACGCQKDLKHCFEEKHV